MGWLGRGTGKTLASLFSKRESGLEDVRPGSRFRRVHDDELIETAEVESVGNDAYGIPHVKFKVTFSRANRYSYEEGSRMLALSTFADRYRERILA